MDICRPGRWHPLKVNTSIPIPILSMPILPILQYHQYQYRQYTIPSKPPIPTASIPIKTKTQYQDSIPSIGIATCLVLLTAVDSWSAPEDARIILTIFSKTSLPSKRRIQLSTGKIETIPHPKKTLCNRFSWNSSSWYWNVFDRFFWRLVPSSYIATQVRWIVRIDHRFTLHCRRTSFCTIDHSPVSLQQRSMCRINKWLCSAVLLFEVKEFSCSVFDAYYQNSSLKRSNAEKVSWTEKCFLIHFILARIQRCL